MWGAVIDIFQWSGFRVTGFDIDKSKIVTLNFGGSYFVRTPSALIGKMLEAGFHATSNFEEVAQTDAVIICVPAPLDEYHQPDLIYVTGTVEAIEPHVHAGNTGLEHFSLPADDGRERIRARHGTA